MKDKAIINYSTLTGWYAKGQARLRERLLAMGFDGDIFTFNNVAEFGAPEHRYTPYGFKPFALDYLRKKGYKQVIWLDASIWPVKPLDSIWGWLESHETLMEEAGHWTGTWTNDNACKNLAMTRDELMTIPMYSAGMTGLDLTKEKPNLFLDEWLHHAKIGSFSGSYDNVSNTESADARCQGHRHDMSIASALRYKYGFELSKGGNFMAYIGPGYTQPKESVIFHLQPTF